MRFKVAFRVCIAIVIKVVNRVRGRVVDAPALVWPLTSHKAFKAMIEQ